MEKREKILQLLRQAFLKYRSIYPIKSMGLFGSFARGDQEEESDVDVLIEFSGPVGMQFIDIAEGLEKELHRRVDLVSKRSIRPDMWKLIENEVIYV